MEPSGLPSVAEDGDEQGERGRTLAKLVILSTVFNHKAKEPTDQKRRSKLERSKVMIRDPWSFDLTFYARRSLDVKSMSSEGKRRSRTRRIEIARSRGDFPTSNDRSRSASRSQISSSSYVLTVRGTF